MEYTLDDKKLLHMALAATKGDIQFVCNTINTLNERVIDVALNRALRYASVNNQTELVLWLLKNTNADVNNTGFVHFSIGESTPLAAACARGHRQIVKALLSNGLCLVNVATTKRRDTPVHSVIWCHRDSWTLLHQAASDGKEEIVDKIMANLLTEVAGERYAEDVRMINSLDNIGRTPLHIAFLGGHINVVKMLLSYGADTDVRNDDDELIAEIAKTWGHQDLITLLKVRYGTD